ncbi:hypothetical protein LXL04_009142 [Taraxacum kok-saghyz]
MCVQRNWTFSIANEADRMLKGIWGRRDNPPIVAALSRLTGKQKYVHGSGIRITSTLDSQLLTLLTPNFHYMFPFSITFLLSKSDNMSSIYRKLSAFLIFITSRSISQLTICCFLNEISTRFL